MAVGHQDHERRVDRRTGYPQGPASISRSISRAADALARGGLRFWGGSAARLLHFPFLVAGGTRRSFGLVIMNQLPATAFFHIKTELGQCSPLRHVTLESNGRSEASRPPC